MEVELPLGYRLDETAQLVDVIESRLHEYSEVKHTLATIGELSRVDIGANVALVKVKLIGAGDRDHTTNEMATLFTERLSDIPNAAIRVLAQASIGAARLRYS